MTKLEQAQAAAIHIADEGGDVAAFLEAVARLMIVNDALNVQDALRAHLDAKAAGQPAMSKGHKGVVAGMEYFTTPEGELYRAPLSNPLCPNGYRNGARWEAPAWQADAAFQRVASWRA